MHDGSRACSGELRSGNSKAKRVTDSDKVVRSGRGKPHSHVQIELLLRTGISRDFSLHRQGQIYTQLLFFDPPTYLLPSFSRFAMGGR
jgi:hypothetical protein